MTNPTNRIVVHASIPRNNEGEDGHKGKSHGGKHGGKAK